VGACVCVCVGVCRCLHETTKQCVSLTVAVRRCSEQLKEETMTMSATQTRENIQCSRKRETCQEVVEVERGKTAHLGERQLCAHELRLSDASHLKRIERERKKERVQESERESEKKRG
jgi:hypothetical protein